MAKKVVHEEHENHERWLVSYADFMTLLFALFVVLYATSRVDNKRVQQVQQSVRFAMHFEGSGGVGQLPLFEGPPSEGGCLANTGVAPRNQKLTQVRKEAEQMRNKLRKKLQEQLLNRQDLLEAVSVQAEGKRIVVRLSASRFFDANQAAVRPEMIPVLDVVGGELAALRRPVRIEGHTDDSPSTTRKFRDNWDLSSSRAAAVTAYLERAHRMPGDRLLAAGHGSTRPIADNDTAAGREANRRIEMVIEAGEDGMDVLGR
ncbi:MAG TPA: flagellar motor protein MotB [Polyangia bacterium]